MMRTATFAKEFRLRSQRDFGYLQQNSKRLRSTFLALYYKDSRLQDQRTRIGLSVSKKVGKAVVRNRLKRLIREQFRNSEYRWKGKDVLVVIYPDKRKQFSLQSDYEKIVLKDVSFLFKKMTELT